MPTEIVSSPSNSQEGRINIDDLKKIIKDFENAVYANFIDDRIIKKIDVVSVPAIIVQHLLDELTDEEKLSANVNIHFGVTLPGQTDCLDGTTDVSNHLTVALLLEKQDETELNNVGDFVITAGFKEAGNNAAEAACCPVIKPPNQH